MGQKINPTGLRIGVIKDWESRWFAKKGEFGDILVEDNKIREFLLLSLDKEGFFCYNDRSKTNEKGVRI